MTLKNATSDLSILEILKKTIKNQKKKKKHEFKFEKWEHRSNMSLEKYIIKFIFKWEEHI